MLPASKKHFKNVKKFWSENLRLHLNIPYAHTKFRKKTDIICGFCKKDKTIVT
jgi:hypothetical protein